jgi:hypothetical protein
MSIPAVWPPRLDFFGTPLVIEPPAAGACVPAKALAGV